MNLLDIQKPNRFEFTTGISEFDAHIDFGYNQIISICTDESMLSTQLLHFLAKKGAEQSRWVWYFDVRGNFDQKLYGIPNYLLERISVLRASNTQHLAQTVGILPDTSLILVDNFNMIYHPANQDQYVSAAMRIFCGLRDHGATIVFTEHMNGMTEKFPTAKFEDVYHRIFLYPRETSWPYYPFSLDITKCGRGVSEPRQLSKLDFEIQRDSDYHKYFIQRYP
jgi:hypothetical protein